VNERQVRTVLAGATVIDGRGSAPGVADVAIEGTRIVEVGRGLDGDRAVDLDGRWLLPGLIDCHVHVMVDSFALVDLIETPFSLNFYIAAQNLRRTLAAGITTARDAGGADLGVKEAVERGYVAGPRLSIAVNLLSITGGHADYWSAGGFSVPDFLPHPGRPDGICDGPAAALARTREMLRAGADVIKVCATGGLLSPRDEPTATQFLSDELHAIVAAATAAGRPVIAHAQGSAGIKSAIRAGVRSIEHGFYLDDEAIDLMLRHEVYLVPTLMAPLGVLELGDARRPAELAKAREVIDVHRQSIARAVSAGVRVVMGTDSGATAHGRNLEELGHLVDVGMTPQAAIHAATRLAAESLGVASRRGSIQPGMDADLVAFNVDPLTRISALAHPDSVTDVWARGRHHVPQALRAKEGVGHG
jgi:imidazolonepropionase-like amidohydrolase